MKTRHKVRLLYLWVLRTQLWFCKQSSVLWQIGTKTQIAFPRHTVWNNHHEGSGSEFLDWICGLKEYLQEMSCWFHPRPCTKPALDPQSLFWPLPMSEGHKEYLGHCCALLVTLLPSQLIQEAAPNADCCFFGSFGFSSFVCQETVYVRSLSGSVLWLLLMLIVWLWAKTKKSRNRHADRNW